MATTPNPKGSPMSTTTVTVVPVRPADTATATVTMTEARNAGELSNRTNVPRLTGILAGVLSVMATGRSVEVTDLFAGPDGKSSGYNLAHRPLSTSQVRPHWENVQVVALLRSTITEKSGPGKTTTITGQSSTTAPVSMVRVFLVPTE